MNEELKERLLAWTKTSSRFGLYSIGKDIAAALEAIEQLERQLAERDAEIAKLKAIVKSNQNCGCAITPCSHDREFAARDIDAERYRKLRNDDNWGEDTCRDGDGAWKILGHLSGDKFDDFIDTRFALRGAA